MNNEQLVVRCKWCGRELDEESTYLDKGLFCHHGCAKKYWEVSGVENYQILSGIPYVS